MEVKLIVASGKNQGKEIPLSGKQFLIGRGEGCHLRPASERISRKHCAIIVAEGLVIARDLGSTNGTSVNGERITGDRELKNGDKLNVGGVLEFVIQYSVDLGGKKSPKVHSIQEAAARTVKKAATDDLDITQWLDDADQGLKPSPLVDLNLKNTSTVDQNMADTTTILLPKDKEKEKKEETKEEKKEEKKPESKAKEKEKSPPAKVVGQFDRNKKPTSETSCDAADDMLRQFFGRKR
jgi:pSer/pThr/pTyr-binding forkhead associated (FHA) protein